MRNSTPLRKFAMTYDPIGDNPGYDGPAISPDGSKIVYAQEPGENRTLWIRYLDVVLPRELPGTEGASRPFWSPNNDLVAYCTDDHLPTVAVG